MSDKNNINGEKKFARKVSELQEFIEDYGDELKILSDKEIRVLNLVSNGKPINQVAEELDISMSEVDDLKKNIRQKLSLSGSGGEGFLEYSVVSSLMRIWLDSLSLIDEKDIEVDFDESESE